MPGIIPPDPGRSLIPADAIRLAKLFDLVDGGFVRQWSIAQVGVPERDNARWLRPDGDRWVATCLRERLVSRETYGVLRAALDRQPAGLPPALFASGPEGRLYALCDDGFEAVAVPA